ncbi:conserved hypothetical protein [Trichinella spiralis]|uniref:hypothetical protein n=1 Tax=Trichinella spiralis TaxID=6334 RepID=UPI0001EFB8AE|nr:conserved hypothetical protein [Trichinella spiralis]
MESERSRLSINSFPVNNGLAAQSVHLTEDGKQSFSRFSLLSKAIDDQENILVSMLASWQWIKTVHLDFLKPPLARLCSKMCPLTVLFLLLGNASYNITCDPYRRIPLTV